MNRRGFLLAAGAASATAISADHAKGIDAPAASLEATPGNRVVDDHAYFNIWMQDRHQRIVAEIIVRGAFWESEGTQEIGLRHRQFYQRLSQVLPAELGMQWHWFEYDARGNGAACSGFSEWKWTRSATDEDESDLDESDARDEQITIEILGYKWAYIGLTPADTDGSVWLDTNLEVCGDRIPDSHQSTWYADLCRQVMVNFPKLINKRVSRKRRLFSLQAHLLETIPRLRTNAVLHHRKGNAPPTQDLASIGAPEARISRVTREPNF